MKTCLFSPIREGLIDRLLASIRIDENLTLALEDKLSNQFKIVSSLALDSKLSMTLYESNL